MEKKYRTTKELAEKDTAIEIMAAMRATRISRLALENDKPDEIQDKKLIERLKKELKLLNIERHQMYQGDEKVKEKILNKYAKEMTDYFLGKKNNVR